MQFINDMFWFISGFLIVFLSGIYLMKDKWED